MELTFSYNLFNLFIASFNYTEDDFRNEIAQNLNSTCFEPTSLDTVSQYGIKLFLKILYSITTLLTLIGNMLVLVVQIKGNKSSKNMRKYLIHLAIADIISGVFCVPFTYVNIVEGMWDFPIFLCPISQYAQLLSIFVTSATQAIIGIERFAATLHPFSDFYFWLERKCNVLLFIVWTSGLVYATIPMPNTYTTELKFENSTKTVCYYDNNLSESKRRFFMSLNFGLTFAGPMIVLAFVYSKIIQHLREHSRVHVTDEKNNHISTVESFELKDLSGKMHQNKIQHKKVHLRISGSNQNRDQVKTIKVGMVTVFGYFVCWMPIKVYELLIEFKLVHYCNELGYYTHVYLYIAFHWLAMAHSAINPIIYSFMSQHFRSELTKLVRKIFHIRQS